MRPAATALLLAGCSLVNPLEPRAFHEQCENGRDDDGDELVDCDDPECWRVEVCGSEVGARCDNGLDDDNNGRADCADPGCYLRLRCFPDSPLARQPSCDPVRSGLQLVEPFTGSLIDETTWSVFPTGDAEAPRLLDRELSACVPGADCALDPRGPPGPGHAGIVSRERFGVGRDQPFRLRVDLLPGTQCEGARSSQELMVAVGFHTGGTWDSGGTAGAGVLGAYVVPGSAPNEALVGFHYHSTSYLPADGTISLADGDPHTVDIETDEASGQAVFSLDGQERWRSPALWPLEPEGHLVAYSAWVLGDCPRVLVDGLELHVERQRAGAGPCGYLHRPLLQDGFCSPDALHAAGTSRPRVVVQPGREQDGYHLVFSTGSGVVGHAVSDDGRTGWRLEPEGRPLLEAPERGPLLTGAYLFSERDNRFELWAEVGAERHLYTAPPDAPTDLRPTGGPLSVEVDGETSLHLPVHWLPEAVVLDEGGYRAWTTGWLQDGRDTIVQARSDDGIAWTVSPLPALLPGEGGEWDSEGVRAPAVVRADGTYLMAYAADPFGGRTSVGLALSADGVTWTRHGDNPLVRGEDEGLDLAGASDPSLRLEDGVVRIWYTGTAFQRVDCPEGLPSVRTPRRLVLAELRFEEGGG